MRIIHPSWVISASEQPRCYSWPSSSITIKPPFPLSLCFFFFFFVLLFFSFLSPVMISPVINGDELFCVWSRLDLARTCRHKHKQKSENQASNNNLLRSLNERQQSTEVALIIMCAHTGLPVSLSCEGFCSLNKQSQRAKPQVLPYVDSHTHTCTWTHKHINTEMYTSKPEHTLINTYVTQMRKRLLREGWGNYSLSHKLKHTNTCTHMTRTKTHRDAKWTLKDLFFQHLTD